MEEVKLEKRRTEMADERTLLAYIRTALNVFIFGFVSHRLYLETAWGSMLLYISIICGIILLMIGIYRFSFYEKALEKKL